MEAVVSREEAAALEVLEVVEVVAFSSRTAFLEEEVFSPFYSSPFQALAEAPLVVEEVQSFSLMLLCKSLSLVVCSCRSLSSVFLSFSCACAAYYCY